MPDIYIKGTDDSVKSVAMDEAFPFLREKNHVISFVGGGGKTTLMYGLAWEYQKRGLKVLVTTTTHIVKPLERENIFAKDVKEVLDLWIHGRIAVIGNDEKNGKLSMPEHSLFAWASAAADVVLIEADGAKRLPCKVPEEFEPVLLPVCDIVIGVAGLDTVGQKLSDICFRKERATELLGVSEEHVMTEGDVAAILLSEQGTRKHVGDREYYVVLNKCDDEARRKKGRKIFEVLKQLDDSCSIRRAVMTGLSPYLAGEGQ